MSETIDTGAFQKNPKTGAGCSKALLWLLLIMFLLSCLCCAGFFGTIYYFENALEKGFVKDPVLAQEKAEETFGELNLPEYIKPQSFLEVKAFGRNFGHASIYSWNAAGEAVTTDAAETPVAAIEEAVPAEETPTEAAPAEENASENSEPNAFNNGCIVFCLLSDVLNGHEKEMLIGFYRGFTQNKEFTIKRVEKAELMINGKAREFTFSWIESNEGRAFLMVFGRFTSKKETLCNVLIVLPDDISQETVTEVLENIQK